MPDNPLANDPQKIWQNQPIDLWEISADDIQRKAKERQLDIRWKLSISWGVTLLFVAFAAFQLISARYTAQRVGYAVALVWGLFAPYQARKMIGSQNLPANSGRLTCLEFFEKELQYWHNRARTVWQWLIGPIILVFLTFSAPVIVNDIRSGVFLSKAVPIVILVLGWGIAIAVLRKRDLKSFQWEMDRLRALRKESITKLRG